MNADLETTTGPLVYLVHIETRLAHAQHYIGYSDSLAARMWHHRRGSGSKFLAAVARAGISFAVVRVWSGQGRDFERHLKRQHHTSRFCPVCSGQSVTVDSAVGDLRNVCPF